MKTVIKEYWQNINTREQSMLLIGGCAVMIWFLYTIIYSPLASTLNDKARLLMEKKETLAWMINIDAQSLTSKGTRTLGNSQLLTNVDYQIKKNPLINEPHQLKQTSTGDIALSYEQVPFSPFIYWLQRFNKKYTFSIKQFHAEKTTQTGVVSLHLVIGAN